MNIAFRVVWRHNVKFRVKSCGMGWEKWYVVSKSRGGGIIGLLNWYWWILARVCINARACECILKPTSANIHKYLNYIAKTFFCSFTRIFSQVYSKLLRRMMILHLAPNCPTALLPCSICYRLHTTLLWKNMKNYG